MFFQTDLFAKALLVEKPWFVHEIKFNQNAGKLDFLKSILIMLPTQIEKEPIL
jgi:hypothetical protein